MPDYRRIKLIVLDVDGTLTDGGIYYDSQGEETKRFDAKDGLGIKVAITAGLEFLVITGRESPMVDRRVKELGIRHVLSGIQEKYPALSDWMERHGISPDEVCYIGDDWNDLQCMKSVGMSMCPADAVKEVREVSIYTASHSGGHGAVRECIEFLLRVRNQWTINAEKTYTVT